MKPTLILLILFWGLSASYSQVVIEAKKDQTHSPSTVPVVRVNDSIHKVVIADTICFLLGIPTVGFSMDYPVDFDLELHFKKGAAFRLKQLDTDTLQVEIAVATIWFEELFTKENEKKWFEEFKNFPAIKNQPDIQISEFSSLKLGAEQLSCYLMTYPANRTEYFKNYQLMTLGIIIPSENLEEGLVIAITKPVFDLSNPLTEIELRIIQSIMFL